MIVSKARSIKGQVYIPGDKSISHRSIMLGSIAKGTTRVSNFLMSDDCLSTISCFKSMGINISINNDEIYIQGKGLLGLQKPNNTLYVGNSGTTIRLLSGILSGQKFESTITGDESIESRPMNRIIIPLRKMNANITPNKQDSLAPLNIKPSNLSPTTYNSPVSSAQIKSCVLLAGLYADGQTSVTEPALSRNHTEIMLKAFGANIKTHDLTSTVTGFPDLRGIDVIVPGDISSAAYFIVAALILPNSKVYMKNVGINPTRAGILKVLKSMGANITLENKRLQCGELVCDILAKTSDLKGAKISGDIIPTLIDELPIIAVAACFADGVTTISDASELKVKECDRIEAMTTQLNAMGANITATDDGMIIKGGSNLKGTTVNSYKDHRVAMSLAVAALNSSGSTTILDSDCVNISFPTFFNDLNNLCIF